MWWVCKTLTLSLAFGVVNKSTWPSFTIFAYDCLFNKRVSTYLTLNQVI